MSRGGAAGTSSAIAGPSGAAPMGRSMSSPYPVEPPGTSPRALRAALQDPHAVVRSERLEPTRVVRGAVERLADAIPGPERDVVEDHDRALGQQARQHLPLAGGMAPLVAPVDEHDVEARPAHAHEALQDVLARRL